MAATYLTVGSRFRPFSYDELIKPLQEATQSHKLLEEAYSELSTKASVWENIADQTNDPVAYSLYKNYSNDLKEQADILNAQGLTPDSRKNMLDLRARYSSDIVPIEQAYTRRRELADEQRKARMQDPTIMFQRDANMMSLDKFLANPEFDYGASYSGALLEKQAGDAAANFAKAITNNPRQWESILGSQYYQTYLQMGYTPAEIFAFSIDDPAAPEPLKELANNVYQSSGIDLWGSPAQQQLAKDYIKRGIYRAIGTGKYDTLQNRNFIPDISGRRGGSEKNPKLPYQNNSLNFTDIPSSSYSLFSDNSAIKKKAMRTPFSYTNEDGSKETISDPYTATILYNTLKKEINDSFSIKGENDKSFKEILDDISTRGYSVLKENEDNKYGTILTRGEDGNLVVMDNAKLPLYDRNKFYRNDPNLVQDIIDVKSMKGDINEELSEKYNNSYKEISDIYSVIHELDGQDIQNHIFNDEDIASIMQEYNIPLDTELKDFINYTGLPYVSYYNRVIPSLSSGAKDKKIDNFTKVLSDQLRTIKSANGRTPKNYLDKNIKSSHGIYKLNDNLEFDKESIKKPSDIFTVDEDTQDINNIVNMFFPPELVLRDYVGIVTSTGQKYAIPISLFSNKLNAFTTPEVKEMISGLIRTRNYSGADIYMQRVLNAALPMTNYNSFAEQPGTLNTDSFTTYEESVPFNLY